MKNVFTTAFLLLSLMALGQNTWNQHLPMNNLGSTFSYSDAIFEDGHFLLCSNDQIVELDQTGTITGQAILPNAPSFPSFLRRRFDPVSGESIFLQGIRQLGPGYKLRFFRPGFGITGEIVLSDDLTGISAQSPAFLALDESTIMVFGQKFAYKIHCEGDTSFSIVWQKPLSIPGNGAATAAIRFQDDFVLFTQNGDVIGVNSAGEQLFTKNQPFKFYSASLLEDGIIVCGSNSDQKAVLAKLTFDGDLIWSKVYADKWYHHIEKTLDGGFITTGSSSAGNIVLQKTDGNGQQIWSTEYQKGFGAKVIPMPDGGYFILAVVSSSPTTIYAIKTDAFGETGAPKTDFFVQNRQLKNDGVKATFEPTSSLFFNGSNGTLITPADSSTATVFSFAPWIGGFDADGLLHLAADNYYASGYSDFRSGVVNGKNSDFNRVWLATKAEIAALRRDFLLDDVLDEPVPFDLLTWPAKGNQNNRYNIDFTKITTDPNLQSAPFVDVNGDGVYNVFDGDYPRIKGDQMAWWVLNDDSIHANTNGRPLRLDVGISAYLYDCPQNESVKNSVFVDFDIINRSTLSYDSTYMGFFTDFDLGCPIDDYLGSIPDANSYYVYNRDTEDEDWNGTPGFGTDIPVQSVTFQNQALNYFIYSVVSLTDPPSAQIYPSAPLEFYSYLQGRWRDGMLPTWGGSGYNPGSTQYVTHVFPSNPSDAQGWSSCTGDIYSGDFKAFASHGPFSFAAGDTFNISLAFTTHHSIPQPCPDIFGLVKPAIQQINSWANDGILEQSPNLGAVQQIALGQSLILGADIPGAMFQWSTGAISPTITVSQPGDYTVTVTSQTGCQSVENVLVKLAAGGNAPEQTANWTAYPNPATDVIQVSCTDCTEGEALEAVLRNAQGVVLKNVQADSNRFPVRLHGLPSGFYWLELWRGSTFLGSRKFTHVE